ncbi:MAG: hypothetical protein ACKV2O_02035 [Acidimicrobiales bacterium]
MAAATIATMSLVAMGLFAFVSLTGGSSGSATPEDAVQQFFDAVGKEDVVGVLNSLPVGERKIFVPLVTDMVTEFERLKVISDVDLAKVPGVDLTFNDLTFEVDEVAPTVAAVSITGGKVTSAVDVAELPIGDSLLDQVFDGERPDLSVSETNDVTDGMDSTDKLVTVKDGDGWHVSLWYTVAEAARIDARLPVPDFGNGIAAVGASSPEEAVRQLFAATAGLDVRRLIELSDPEEAAALHDYAPLFIDDAEDAVDQLFDESNVSIQLTPLDLTVEEAFGHKNVIVGGIEGSVEADGLDISFEIRGGCSTFEINGEKQETCVGDLDKLTDSGVPPAVAEIMGKLSAKASGIVTTEVDGKWYISPTLTVGNGMLSVLRAFDAKDITTLAEAFGSGMNSSGFSLGARLDNSAIIDESFGDPEENGLGSVDGYGAYVEACGDGEFAIYEAANEAEWDALLADAVDCAEPFLVAGDILPEDLIDEVAYPECYPDWPYADLSDAEYLKRIDAIDACLATK